jgi:hypothetical protein
MVVEEAKGTRKKRVKEPKHVAGVRTMFERIKKWWRGFRERRAKEVAEHWRRDDFIWVGAGAFLVAWGDLADSVPLMVIGFFGFWTGFVYYNYDETIERIGASRRFWREYFIPARSGRAKSKQGKS